MKKFYKEWKFEILVSASIIIFAIPLSIVFYNVTKEISGKIESGGVKSIVMELWEGKK